MIIYHEICVMKNKNTLKTTESVAPLLIGCLLTSILFLINYVKLIHLGLEVVLSPIVVISLLAYGESLLIYLLLVPISIGGKIINRIYHLSTTVKQKLTFKQI